MKKLGPILSAATIAFLAVDAHANAGETFRRLSGAQIRAKVAGMQFTDEVHWRDVFDRDGTLRSYSMGTKKVGTWAIEKDELCLHVEEPDDGVTKFRSRAIASR